MSKRPLPRRNPLTPSTSLSPADLPGQTEVFTKKLLPSGKPAIHLNIPVPISTTRSHWSQRPPTQLKNPTTGQPLYDQNGEPRYLYPNPEIGRLTLNTSTPITYTDDDGTKRTGTIGCYISFHVVLPETPLAHRLESETLNNDTISDPDPTSPAYAQRDKDNPLRKLADNNGSFAPTIDAQVSPVQARQQELTANMTKRAAPLPTYTSRSTKKKIATSVFATYTTKFNDLRDSYGASKIPPELYATELRALFELLEPPYLTPEDALIGPNLQDKISSELSTVEVLLVNPEVSDTDQSASSTLANDVSNISPIIPTTDSDDSDE